MIILHSLIMINEGDFDIINKLAGDFEETPIA
jgi:hypothetical protein